MTTVESHVSMALTRTADVLEGVGRFIEDLGHGLRTGRLEVGPLRIATAKSMSTTFMNAFELGVDRGRSEVGLPVHSKSKPRNLTLV